MEVHLTKDLAAHIQRMTPSPLMRDFLALAIAMTIARRRFSPHSRVVKRALGGRYSESLRLMQSLPFISRDDSYVTATLAKETGKQSHCKTWYANGLKQVPLMGNINALLRCRGWACPAGIRGLVKWRFGSDFRSRLASAFDWFATEHSVSPEQSQLFGEILEIVGAALSQLEAPDLSFEEVLELCDGDKAKAHANWNALEKLRNGVPDEARFDLGHRVYHPLTNLKKEIRRKFTVRGSPVVEVDKHATYPTIIGAKMAPPGEQERLLALSATGDFYGQMADLLLGIDCTGEPLLKDRFKKQFQRDVVFGFRPKWSPIWRAFQREFPGTAAAIADIRDGSEVVVNERVERDSQGVKRTIKTHWGQRRLSRILSRVESEIFLQRALVRLHRDYGIAAVPIHDCLMVAEEHVGVVKQVIEEAATVVLGFTPVIKSTAS